MLVWRRSAGVLLSAILVCFAYSISNSAETKPAPAPPQEQCMKMRAEELAAQARKVRRPLRYFESEKKSQLNTLPGSAVVKVEISDVAPEGSDYCASLGDKPVRVISAVSRNDKEKRTTLTLDVPEVGFGWAKQMELVLVSFPVDKKTGQLNKDSPDLSVTQTLRVSDGRFSFLCAVAGVVFAYLMVVLAIGRIRGSYRWDPVYLTSDTFDKASLSQFQVLGFSLLVIGLLVFVLFRAGTLSDISEDILLLLGISATGTAGSKVAELMNKRLSFENWSWLRNREWLLVHEEGAGKDPDPAVSRWGDLLRAADGSLDVYSFQLAVFSLFVGLALLRSDLSALETFTIPKHLLGLLGLSNVTYIGGKAVAPTSVGELDKKVKDLRDAEKIWIGKVTAGVVDLPTQADKQQRAVTLAPKEYQEYITAAREAARMLKSLYGADGTKFKVEPISDADLMPVFP